MINDIDILDEGIEHRGFYHNRHASMRPADRVRFQDAFTQKSSQMATPEDQEFQGKALISPWTTEVD